MRRSSRPGTTAILVTHDQHEAFAVADEIGIMHQGRIQQWDTPYNLYHRPGRTASSRTSSVRACSSTERCSTAARCAWNSASSTAATRSVAGPACETCERGCDVDVLLRPTT